MTTWQCQGCPAVYAVGLPACPACGSTEYEEYGVMPKISNGAGATDAQGVVGTAPEDIPAAGGDQGEPAAAEPKKRPRKAAS